MVSAENKIGTFQSVEVTHLPLRMRLLKLIKEHGPITIDGVLEMGRKTQWILESRNRSNDNLIARTVQRMVETGELKWTKDNTHVIVAENSNSPQTAVE